MATKTGVQYYPLMTIGHLVASEDYSGEATEWNCFVVVNASADHTFTKAGAGEEAVAIMNDKPAQGEPGELIIGGSGLLKLGGTVAAGDKVKSDANGYGVKASADTEWFGGICLQAGVADDIIEVLLVKGFIAG